ncbi:bifunctional RNase H/acid phosphatase, partial [Streptomyces sp. NPDC059781]|uniref:bifunctional RNase H/acid phosphatase n=1 Tax=Streptomyces sp. NPDC059781 TaxID=3346943 RepID=UPI003669C5A5
IGTGAAPASGAGAAAGGTHASGADAGVRAARAIGTGAAPASGAGAAAGGTHASGADAGVRAARATGTGTAPASGAAGTGATPEGVNASEPAGADARAARATGNGVAPEGGTVAEAVDAASGATGTGAAPEAAGARADADLRAAQAVATPSAGWAPADLGPPATFVLLRHGETPLTPQKRFSGSGGSDPSLSSVGREQAEKVAEFLARRGTVQAVVASPLARTRETAGIVAARLGLGVAVEDGLRETDFGAWEGLTFGEVRERHPDDLNAWLSSPDAEPTGGGESFAATAARVAATRDRLTAEYRGRTVLLVTHVTPIKTFVRLALGAPPEALFRMELSAASLSAVAYYADGNASVRLFNDTSHLRQD